MLTSEQTRIAADLLKGSRDLPYKKFVHVYAGDIVALCEALASETARANAAESQLAESQLAAPQTPTP